METLKKEKKSLRIITEKQRRLAKELMENQKRDKPLNGGQLVEKVGYSKHLVDYPKKVIEQQGVKDALAEYGFNEDNAKKVVTDIMLSDKTAPAVRLKATDQLFRVVGTYAPEKQAIIQVELNEQARDRARKALDSLD